VAAHKKGDAYQPQAAFDCYAADMQRLLTVAAGARMAAMCPTPKFEIDDEVQHRSDCRHP